MTSPTIPTAAKIKPNECVIHNSAEFPDCTYARVNVHFVNVVDAPDGEGVLRVPGTECVISRMARKDNTSKYYVNGKGASFSEVADELAKRQCAKVISGTLTVPTLPLPFL